MTVRLAHLRSNQRDLTVDIFGDGQVQVQVSYKPLALTNEEQHQFTKKSLELGFLIQEIIDGRVSPDEIPADPDIFDYLVKMVASWDLVDDVLDAKGKPVMDDDGEVKTTPVPITVEGLRRVPGLITQRIYAAIGEDSRPNAMKSGNSAVASSTGKDRGDGSRTGISALPARNTWA